MMTLYTAIGRYKITKERIPMIVSGGKEYAMDAYELILWSSLAFQILTYDELRAEFYEKERELRILGEFDFDYYLNRLTSRHLIVSGRDCTGVDALYDLLGHLHINCIPNSLVVKTLTFFKLYLFNGFSFKDAKKVFLSEQLESTEKQVLSLAKSQLLSTAELIQCTQDGVTCLHSHDELMDLLYADDDMDYKSIVTENRFSEMRVPVLTAILNLYFKQQITFEIL